MRWLTSERLSGTVTFLFTDIEGSTGLLKRLGRDRYRELLKRQQVLLREAFAMHRGEEVDTQGDSFFVAFRSASDAVAAAVAIQQVLADHEWPDGVDLRVRIGIHSGEAAAAGERYVGFSVHRAARIGAIGHGGQVLVSSSTRELVEDDLPPGVFLRDLGSYRLKDVDRPERISQAVAEGLRVEFPPLRGAEQVKQAPLRRRSLLVAMLAGVVAAAVSIPVFALGGGSGETALAGVGADSVGAIDSGSGRIAASIPVGASPSSVAAYKDAVWVTNAGDDSVSRIDSKTNTRVQTIPDVGSHPGAIAIGDGFVWVVNSGDGTVSKIDPRANGGNGDLVDTIRVGNDPTGIAFGGGRLWVANSIDRTVMEFVPGSHKPLHTFEVPAGADALAYGFGFVWVVSGPGNSVTRIAARSGTVLPPIQVGNGPSALAVDGDFVWVANRLDGTVSRIDPGDTTRVKVIPAGEGPVGVAANDSAVWVSGGRTGTLSRIDQGGGSVERKVETGNRPQGLALAGDMLYAAVRASGLAHRGGKLTMLALPFGSIDPAALYDQGLFAATSVAYDGLIGYERVGGSGGARLVPDLATSIPAATDGGRTYTFQVHRGIHYSTGVLVQPADFRRSIERLLANQQGAGSYFTGIVGADACTKRQPKRKPRQCDLSRGIVVDAASNTITFHLTAPDPDFLAKLAAADYAVPSGTPLFGAHLPLPATGPYMIESFDPKRGVRLVRNPRFREWSPAAQPSGYPDEIALRFVADPTAQVEAMKRNDADYLYLFPPDVAPSLRKDGYGSRLHVDPGLWTLYLFLNTRLAPFDNVNVRRALNFAVDRDKLVALRGGPDVAQSSCQVLAPNFAGYARYCPYAHDLARAKRLVAASGTTGQAVTVWMPEIRKTTGDYLVSVLQSLGYKAKLKVIREKVPGDYFRALAAAKDPVQAGFGGWTPDYPSSAAYFSQLLTCAAYKPGKPDNINYGGFCNPGIDRQIAHATELQTSDPNAASLLWSKIDREIVDQAPWVTMANSKQVNFLSDRVGNYQYNPISGVLLDQLWVR